MSEPTLEDFQNYMFDDDIDTNDPDLDYHVTTFLRKFGYYKPVIPPIPRDKQNLIDLFTNNI